MSSKRSQQDQSVLSASSSRYSSFPNTPASTAYYNSYNRYATSSSSSSNKKWRKPSFLKEIVICESPRVKKPKSPAFLSPSFSSQIHYEYKYTTTENSHKKQNGDMAEYTQNRALGTESQTDQVNGKLKLLFGNHDVQQENYWQEENHYWKDSIIKEYTRLSSTIGKSDLCLDSCQEILKEHFEQGDFVSDKNHDAHSLKQKRKPKPLQLASPISSPLAEDPFKHFSAVLRSPFSLRRNTIALETPTSAFSDGESTWEKKAFDANYFTYNEPSSEVNLSYKTNDTVIGQKAANYNTTTNLQVKQKTITQKNLHQPQPMPILYSKESHHSNNQPSTMNVYTINSNPYATSLWQNVFGNETSMSQQIKAINENSDDALQPQPPANSASHNSSQFSVPSLDTFPTVFSRTAGSKATSKTSASFISAGYKPLSINANHINIKSDMQTTSDEFEQNCLCLYDKCLLELLETEINYRNDLSIIVDVYIKTLGYDQYRYLLSNDEKHTIFGNIRELISMCDLFLDDVLQELRNAVAKAAEERSSRNQWDDLNESARGKDRTTLLSLASPTNIKQDIIYSPTTVLQLAKHLRHDSIDIEFLRRMVWVAKSSSVDIGEIMLRYFTNSKYHFFKNHFAYSKSFDQRQSLLLQKLNVSGGPDFAKWYSESLTILKTTEATSWDLPSLLIKPIQRLVKYRLLLEQLISHAAKASLAAEKIAKLKEAKDLIHEMISDINKAKNGPNDIPDSTNMHALDAKSHHRAPEVLSKPQSQMSFKSCNLSVKSGQNMSKSSQDNSKSQQSSMLSSRKASSIMTGISASQLSIGQSSTCDAVASSHHQHSQKQTKMPTRAKSRYDPANLKGYQLRATQYNKLPPERIKFVNLVLDFKHKYERLNKLQRLVVQHMNSLQNLINVNISITSAYQRVANCYTISADTRTETKTETETAATKMKLKRHNFAQKQTDLLKKKVILLSNEVLNKINVCLAHCEQIKALTNEDRQNRIHYHEYVISNEKANAKNSSGTKHKHKLKEKVLGGLTGSFENGGKISSESNLDKKIVLINTKGQLQQQQQQQQQQQHDETISEKAQKCIKIENLLLSELPSFNKHMDVFVSLIAQTLKDIFAETWVPEGEAVAGSLA